MKFNRKKQIDKQKRIVSYFNAIGRRYDIADTAMSFGLHLLWRRSAIKRLPLGKEISILDLCGGTGEFARKILQSSKAGGLVVVCDLSTVMMSAGKKKAMKNCPSSNIDWVEGDAESLSFKNDVFDAVIVGWGIRNLVHMEKGLLEIFRVLKPRGKLIVMEFSIPPAKWLKWITNWYFFRAMPFLGKFITGDAEPFTYLAESVRAFPPPEAMTGYLEKTGWVWVNFQRLSGGIVTIYDGTKPIY